MEECLNFNQFVSQIWYKYMQVAFYDLADDMKVHPLKLDKEYFTNLPISTLKNLDNFKLFRNFTDYDM